MLKARLPAFGTPPREVAGVTTAENPLTEKVTPEDTLVDVRIRFVFAVLSLLGGLVLAGDPDTEAFAWGAVFVAIFGFVYVDWLEYFCLPPLVAYFAMIVSALYCVSGFVDFDVESKYYFSLAIQQTNNRHLIAVSELLVLVQGILMLQAKTRRVCEQLCVFCLLELIVAAVFNNTILFGLVLIPIGVFTAFGLMLLSLDGESSNKRPYMLMFQSVMILLIPAVILIGITFFYAIPRTTEAAQMRGQGNVLTGFSDKVRLEQFGQMLQSSDVAMHIWLKKHSTGEPYKAYDGLYLRGRVLEAYHAIVDKERPSADWSSLRTGVIHGATRLPNEYYSPRASDQNFYDSVRVEIDCEAMSSPSLFAIAPYHNVGRDSEYFHEIGRWTIRRSYEDQFEYPRVRYVFGTHSFRGGLQSEWIGRFAKGEKVVMPKIEDMPVESSYDAAFVENNRRTIRFSIRKQNRSIEDYRRHLVMFDGKAMPTVKRLANAIAKSIPEDERTDVAIARQFEQFLAATGGFEYSLRLDSTPQMSVDPIEQFVATNRRGHCQFFASALVMMLRSQGIPSRLVVGYHTDDYNELGGYYVARQSHAHAWVEALIPAKQVDSLIYGQNECDQYWLRLDPTPGGASFVAQSKGVNSVLDAAQTWWKTNVVDLSASEDQLREKSVKHVATITSTRTEFASWLQRTMDSVRAGQLGGDAFSGGHGFSWKAAAIGIGTLLCLVTLGRYFGSIRFRKKSRKRKYVARPKVAFYAEAIVCLEKAGIFRLPSETPAEFADKVAIELNAVSELESTDETKSERYDAAPMRLLTDVFYRVRFGGVRTDDVALENENGSEATTLPSHTQIAEALHEVKRAASRLRKRRRAAYWKTAPTK
ncbi:Protein-glutamine gamma-glutamyltransferase [Planctomycetes bacterium CA13]|uniref:Protein-glutamine gamma-glutamyltransferase n=2 Tax=Novipirellula herctigrandis TaxID=2527986 RepID=A0A5C5ZBX7_9BACT|nr:Protein-glutamine gamma-glutamyltransferase [Planctomycetes bacterium CA13]